MFDRLDRNEYTFRDTGLEEAVRSAITQMNKMADDCLRDYLTARGFILVTPERDAKVAAKALREAADALDAEDSNEWADDADLEAVRIIGLLRDRADRIEREASESDADA